MKKMWAVKEDHRSLNEELGMQAVRQIYLC